MEGFRPARLAELRKAQNLSVDALAVLAVVSPETVRRAEKEEARPSGRVVRAFADVLGVDIDELAPPAGPLTLTDHRHRAGLRLEDIAAAAEVTAQMVSRVEAGAYGVRDRIAWAAAYQLTDEQWTQAWEAGREAHRKRITRGTRRDEQGSSGGSRRSAGSGDAHTDGRSRDSRRGGQQ